MPEPYAKSPVFDELTLPDALRNDHRTKSGTWGLLRVLEGEARLIFSDPPSDHHVTPTTPAIIPPLATHHVVLLGPVTMQVEFYRECPISGESTADG
jgi:tellurite resistance-related uncharacterized protein